MREVSAVSTDAPPPGTEPICGGLSAFVANWLWAFVFTAVFRELEGWTVWESCARSFCVALQV